MGHLFENGFCRRSIERRAARCINAGSILDGVAGHLVSADETLDVVVERVVPQSGEQEKSVSQALEPLRKRRIAGSRIRVSDPARRRIRRGKPAYDFSCMRRMSKPCSAVDMK